MLDHFFRRANLKPTSDRAELPETLLGRHTQSVRQHGDLRLVGLFGLNCGVLQNRKIGQRLGERRKRSDHLAGWDIDGAGFGNAGTSAV